MKPAAEFDIIVYGASGYTGRLVAEHMARRYGAGGQVTWAMAGRSAAKLAEVRDEIGAPETTPLLVADAADSEALRKMASRAKAVVTTAGPYQLYGSALVAACADLGTDYLDLCGEPHWMRAMIDAHEAQARASGARILFSCGFDSLPPELGVWFCEDTARKTLGSVVPLVKGRHRDVRGGPGGGSLASGRATMAAVRADPAAMAVVASPFGLTPGFAGPPQPSITEPRYDPDVGDVVPFFLAGMNTKNVYRANMLMGFPYGRDFVYDEMMVAKPDGAGAFPVAAGAPELKPGEGPTKEAREAGFFDMLFIGVAADGRKVRVSVKGDQDPGFGSTSKMISETAICLIGAPDVAGGVWTSSAALGGRLVERLQHHAGLTFTVEN